MTYQYLLGLPMLGKLEGIGHAIVDGELERYFREQLGSKTFNYTNKNMKNSKENSNNNKQGIDNVQIKDNIYVNVNVNDENNLNDKNI